MNTRKLTRTALFAALTAAGAFIRIPLGYSSITLQFLCTAMAGCLLAPSISLYGIAIRINGRQDGLSMPLPVSDSLRWYSYR